MADTTIKRRFVSGIGKKGGSRMTLDTPYLPPSFQYKISNVGYTDVKEKEISYNLKASINEASQKRDDNTIYSLRNPFGETTTIKNIWQEIEIQQQQMAKQYFGCFTNAIWIKYVKEEKRFDLYTPKNFQIACTNPFGFALLGLKDYQEEITATVVHRETGESENVKYWILGYDFYSTNIHEEETKQYEGSVRRLTDSTRSFFSEEDEFPAFIAFKIMHINNWEQSESFTIRQIHNPKDIAIKLKSSLTEALTKMNIVGKLFKIGRKGDLPCLIISRLTKYQLVLKLEFDSIEGCIPIGDNTCTLDPVIFEFYKRRAPRPVIFPIPEITTPLPSSCYLILENNIPNAYIGGYGNVCLLAEIDSEGDIQNPLPFTLSMHSTQNQAKFVDIRRLNEIISPHNFKVTFTLEQLTSV
jgi:hypothetical protein